MSFECTSLLWIGSWLFDGLVLFTWWNLVPAVSNFFFCLCQFDVDWLQWCPGPQDRPPGPGAAQGPGQDLGPAPGLGVTPGPGLESIVTGRERFFFCFLFILLFFPVFPRWSGVKSTLTAGADVEANCSRGQMLSSVLVTVFLKWWSVKWKRRREKKTDSLCL